MKRRKYTPDFKRKVVLEAMRGDETARSIAARHGVNPNQVGKWKTEAHDRLLEVFGRGGGNSADRETARLVERLWRSLKYEAVYLEELVGGHHARRVIASWLDHYNQARPHLALSGRTPAEVYFAARGGGMATARNQVDPANGNEA